MAAFFVPETGMVQNALYSVLPEMIVVATSLAIQIRDKRFVTETGMEKVVAASAFLKAVICLVTTNATRLMVENSAITTGMDLDARCFVALAMARVGITCAIQGMAEKFVWTTGLGLSARRTANRPTTVKGTMLAESTMEVRCATKVGLDQTALCTAYQGMTRMDIISVIPLME